MLSAVLRILKALDQGIAPLLLILRQRLPGQRTLQRPPLQITDRAAVQHFKLIHRGHQPEGGEAMARLPRRLQRRL